MKILDIELAWQSAYVISHSFDASCLVFSFNMSLGLVFGVFTQIVYVEFKIKKEERKWPK